MTDGDPWSPNKFYLFSRILSYSISFDILNLAFCLLFAEVISQCNSILNCQSCHFESFGFICDQCNEGYFKSSTTCQQCPSLCYSCASASNCYSCKPGYYGADCSSACIGCNNEKCEKGTGTCIDGCQDGFFQLSPGPCYKCFKTCTMCSTDTICSVCQAGFYGPRCNTSCSGCIDGNCDINSGSCSLGCNSGFYTDSSTGHCPQCQTNCTTCTARDTCTGCVDGFYLTTESECKPCSEHCKIGTVCNPSNGYCEEGCENMWSGEQCSAKCPPGCKHCGQNNTLYCGLCDNGRYGESCENSCSSACKSDSASTEQICNKTSGFCKFGCEDGAWGETCEYSCGKGCTGGQCNLTTGYCLDSCRFNYHGEMCNNLCSDNCLNATNSSSNRLCNEQTGQCVNGCHPGWFGENCSQGCSNYCQDVNCFRSNGSCIHGCLDGYSGSRCDQRDQGMTYLTSNIT